MNKQEKSKLHRFINDNEFLTTYVGGGAEFETTVVDSQRLRRLIRKMNDQPEPQITDEQAWNKIAEAYPETAQSLRITLDHAVFGHGDKPQKVKVPPSVDRYINFCIGSEITLAEALTKERLYTTGPFKFVDEALEWLESPINQNIFAEAWLHGWDVKEEPKWVVKRKDNGKFVESLALGKRIGLIAETTALVQEDGYKFTNRESADAVAVLVDGTIEKV